jgi:hypothetical protein
MDMMVNIITLTIVLKATECTIVPEMKENVLHDTTVVSYAPLLFITNLLFRRWGTLEANRKVLLGDFNILLLVRLAIEAIEVGVDGINLSNKDVRIFFGEEIVAIATGVEHDTCVLFATCQTVGLIRRL